MIDNSVEQKEFLKFVLSGPFCNDIETNIFSFLNLSNRTVCISWKKGIDAAILYVWRETVQNLQKERRLDLLQMMKSVEQSHPDELIKCKALSEKSRGLVLFAGLSREFSKVFWPKVGYFSPIAEVPHHLKREDEHVKNRDLITVFQQGLLPELRKGGAFESSAEPQTADEIRVWWKDPKSKSHLENVTVLDLKYLGLGSCPEEIADLHNLITLDISKNCLQSFTLNCSKLFQLKELNLGDNCIRVLEIDISHCTYLEKLLMGWNKLKKFSIDLSNCPLIKIIDLRSNELQSLSLDLGALFFLEELYLNTNLRLKTFSVDLRRNVNLKILWLFSCGLTSFSSDLTCNVKLQELFLMGNELEEFSNDLSGCTQLQRFHLTKNKLSKFNCDLRSPLLEELFVNENQLKQFSIHNMSLLTGLKILKLEKNKLTSLPDDIGHCALQELCLHNNQLTTLEESLLKQISASEGKLHPQKISLSGNHFLFLWSEWDPDASSALLNAHERCKNYVCLSAFSQLCQAAINGEDLKTMQELFKLLKKQDQELIFTYVKENDLEWAKIHLFDNRHLFNLSLRNAIYEKFYRFSEQERGQIADDAKKMASGAGDATDFHLFDQVLLLIDAMDRLA